MASDIPVDAVSVLARLSLARLSPVVERSLGDRSPRSCTVTTRSRVT